MAQRSTSATLGLVVSLGLVGSLAAVAAPAAAEVPVGAPPQITGIGVAFPFDDDRALPEIHIDWGSHIDAPWGMLFDVGGWYQSKPRHMTSVIDYTGYEPWPNSYRPAACYSACDHEGVEAGIADLVTGSWWHPAISETIHQPPPTLAASRDAEGVHLTVDPGGHASAPIIDIFRDGEFLVSLDSSTRTYTDARLAEPLAQPLVTYRARACYSDCVWFYEFDDGFARWTPLGPSLIVVSPSYDATLTATCSPAEPAVGTPIDCVGTVDVALHT